jgi:hypothetical protein
MTQVSVGRDFVWASDAAGAIYFSPLDAPGAWRPIANPQGVVQLSVGTSEVWGVTASGQIYRRSAAGIDDWEPVDGRLTQVAVGESAVWGLEDAQPKSRGFR